MSQAMEEPSTEILDLKISYINSGPSTADPSFSIAKYGPKVDTKALKY